MLTSALTGEGVHSVYQPIVDVARGAVVGYEALARFTGYPVTDPETWFAAADASGCGAQLQAVALRCGLAARDRLPQNCFLTVNIAPDMLPAPWVRQVWDEAGDLDGVIVELTEHARIDDFGRLEPDLNRLRGAGARLAIDDAGSGYAGLTHLLAVRPAMIKLDRALIVDIDRDEAKRALVEMIGTFAGRIDAWLLAEGIEREGELAVIAALGVPLAQGYYLARPAPPWAGLTEDAERTLLIAQTRRADGTVRGLIDHAPVVTEPGAVAAAFANTTSDVVVLQDHHHRPIAVLTDRHAPIPVVTAGLRVNVDTSISDAALRAVTREHSDWATPVLCTDNAGRYLGIIRIERLVHALARSADQDAPERQ